MSKRFTVRIKSRDYNGLPVYWIYDTLQSEWVVQQSSRGPARRLAAEWNAEERAKPASQQHYNWNATPEQRRACFTLIMGGAA